MSQYMTENISFPKLLYQGDDFHITSCVSDIMSKNKQPTSYLNFEPKFCSNYYNHFKPQLTKFHQHFETLIPMLEVVYDHKKNHCISDGDYFILYETLLSKATTYIKC